MYLVKVVICKELYKLVLQICIMDDYNGLDVVKLFFRFSIQLCFLNEKCQEAAYLFADIL